MPKKKPKRTNKYLTTINGRSVITPSTKPSVLRDAGLGVRMSKKEYNKKRKQKLLKEQNRLIRKLKSIL